MSNYATETVSIKAARKMHRCQWCWGSIEIGESYKRYRCYSYGDASTVHMHPECYDAMSQEAQVEGGWFEWTPGQERPAVSSDRGNGE